MAHRRVLILGGTAEAAQLAANLDARPEFEPITSLAGRTRNPAPVPGAVRMGGFGGADGLARYLTANAIDAVVDATHPFAERMSHNAAEACQATRLPCLRLERPPWRSAAGDDWIDVPDMDEAARRLPGSGHRVFLSIGRQDLAPFEGLADIWFLLRMIDPPVEPLPLARHDVILGRGPFDADAERQVLTEHRVDSLVSRNSGGDATYGKILAARELGLPVIMVGRPPSPGGDSVASVDAAVGWLNAC